MRILHILDHSLPLQSGYVFRTQGILAAQRALGWHTYQLTTPKQTAASQPIEEVDGWTFYRTLAGRPALASFPVARELVQMRATERRVGEVAREIKPDILHAHSPVLNGFPALRLGRRLGIPVVYEVRAFWEDAAVDHGTARPGGLRYRVSRGLESRVLREADAVTTICQGLRNDIVGRGIPAAKVTVVPNSVDLAAFDSQQRSDGELRQSLGLESDLVLGFIGSFYAYEGLDLLLRAMRIVVDRLQGVKLLLVGGGPEEPRLKALVRDLKLDANVVVVGRVPHEQIGQHYDLIDVCVYPRLPMRLTELVTPLKPLEAMAHRKVIIASDVGGHRELITDGRSGFLFAAGDCEAFAARICEIIARRAAWPMVGSAGRRFVEQERSWPVVVERYRAVYEPLFHRRA